MAITDLFEDSSSNRHDGIYLAHYFLGTSLHYTPSGKPKGLRKAKAHCENPRKQPRNSPSPAYGRRIIIRSSPCTSAVLQLALFVIIFIAPACQRRRPMPSPPGPLVPALCRHPRCETAPGYAHPAWQSPRPYTVLLHSVNEARQARSAGALWHCPEATPKLELARPSSATTR